MINTQGINNVKLVIISLDGCLLDLNRLRYNHLKQTVEKYNIVIDKKIFSDHLGSEKTMYDFEPLNKQADHRLLNKVIETDLMNYIRLKKEFVKEGSEELLRYFKQKEIEVAIITTHQASNAIELLKLAKLYKYVDYVVGTDSHYDEPPKTGLINLILNQVKVKAEDTLLISNYDNLTRAGLDLLIPTIFVQDLVEVDYALKPRLLGVVKNNLHVINTLVFSKYDSELLFSNYLGLSADMDLDSLKNRYEVLMKKYADDILVCQMIEDTYLSIVLRKSPDIVDNDLKADDSILDISEEVELSKPEIRQEQYLSKTLNGSENPLVINELIDLINDGPKESVKENVEDKKEEIIEKKTNFFLQVTYNFAMCFLLSIIITLISLIVYVGLNDFINSSNYFAIGFRNVVGGYLNIINNFWQWLFATSHKLIESFPSYQSFVTSFTKASPLIVRICFITIFDFGILFIISLLVKFIKNIKNKE